MKGVSLMILLLTAAAVAQTTSSLTVEEVFSVDTPEEMEAALADGYPMPWLEELLNDQSIPEEDRYWLDCRVRAVIARDMHLFYDREGIPVTIEAHSVNPGENYWQENFIVRKEDSFIHYESPDLPSGIWNRPGYILNRYGERIGEIAVTADRVRLSRDASLGVFLSEKGHITADNALLLHPDGTFIEIPVDPVFVQYAVSDNGEIAVYYSRIGRPDSSNTNARRLYVFDRNGNTVFERIMPAGPISGSSAPVVSPDGRYIAVALNNWQVWLLDAVTGETLFEWDSTTGNSMSFTQDSRYLCVTAGRQGLSVFDCDSGEEVFSLTSNIEHFGGNLKRDRISSPCMSGSSGIISVSRNQKESESLPWEYHREVYDISSGELILRTDTWHPVWISPNGKLLFVGGINTFSFGGNNMRYPPSPVSVYRIER